MVKPLFLLAKPPPKKKNTSLPSTFWRFPATLLALMGAPNQAIEKSLGQKGCLPQDVVRDVRLEPGRDDVMLALAIDIAMMGDEDKHTKKKHQTQGFRFKQLIMD